MCMLITKLLLIGTLNSVYVFSDNWIFSRLDDDS